MGSVMASGGGAVRGLVQIPTTQTTGVRLPARVTVEVHRVEEGLGALVPNPARQRLARLRRQVGFAARGHEAGRREAGRRDDYCAMVTLTYADVRGWAPEHLERFTDRVRHWMARRGLSFRYVWVAELQRRGALHYHFAVWLPCGWRLPKPDEVGWWPYGSTRIEAARDAVAYLMKYLSKGSASVRFPGGARTHGAGGLEFSIRRARRWLGLPSFVRSRADCLDDWRRAPGGGWADPDGVVVPSEWARVVVGVRGALVRVADYGRPFHADGAFSWISRGATARAD